MSETARFLTDVIVFGLLTSNAITLCALRARITDLEKRINKLNSSEKPNNFDKDINVRSKERSSE